MMPGSYRPTFELAEEAETVPAPTDELAVPPPAARARLRLAMPSTRVWLAAISAILAIDLAMTVSLMAVQLRGSAAPATQTDALSRSEVRTLVAEKPGTARSRLFYDYIQNSVQASYGQPIR